MSKKNNNSHNRLEVREVKEKEVHNDVPGSIKDGYEKGLEETVQNALEQDDTVVLVEDKKIEEEPKVLYAKILQNLNLRTDDNLDGDIMCVMPKDKEVKILASQKENEFVFVEYKDSSITMCGYCMHKYLTEPYEK